MATTRPYREPRLMELQGARLRAMRMARSWTQREMMERVNAARGETGRAGPRPGAADGESTWATYESGVAMITPTCCGPQRMRSRRPTCRRWPSSGSCWRRLRRGAWPRRRRWRWPG